jgi:LCP family protein required for cell wall assembly
MRLDIFLTTFHNIQSRNKSAELIKNNKVKVNGTIITKSSFKVEENSNIVMLSIPRDFWIDDDITSGRINEILRDAPKGYIKKGYDEDLANEMAMALLQSKIEQLTGLGIHRYMKIDFKGFEQMIDAVDGVDVYVEKTIDDKAYPDGNWGYEHFFLQKGDRHLDGKTALKFARSRHDSSDFDRASRQQKILEAFRKKALSVGILTSPKKIQDFFNVLSENFETNLSVGEIISLADFASKFNRSRLISHVLTDNDLETGGFLVTPDRELYGGAFVLVPYLNLIPNHKFDQIKMFSEIIFFHRYLAINPPVIEIQNATSTTGLARKYMMNLERYGITIHHIYTAEEKSEITLIEYIDNEKNRDVINLMQRLFSFETSVVESIPLDSKIDEDKILPVDIRITIGSDYKKPYRIPLKEDEILE